MRKVGILTSVVLDHLLLLEELGEVLALRQADQLASELGDLGLHVSRNGSAFVVVVTSDTSAGLSISDFNDIANFQLEAGDVNDLSINDDVTVGNHLSCLEDGLCVTKSPNGGGQTHFQKSKEVQAGVAAHSLRFLKRV